MRKTITTTIDENLWLKSKEKSYEISEILDNALLTKLNEKKVIIINSDACAFCGKVEEKATKQKLDGLTWLWPDEKWICDSCLKSEMRKVANKI